MTDAEQLYDQDFFLWTRETAAALRARRFADLDVDHIAEEIEDMGLRDKRELESRLTRILEHLLKLRLAKGIILDYNQNGRRASVVRQRNELERVLQDSPSLRRLITNEVLNRCYRHAAAAVTTEYKTEAPKECPFTEEEILSGSLS